MVRVTKKADERKTELLDIAISLFMTNGYQNTSVKNIYSAAGGSFGMFYHHFKSKEEIFEAAMNRYTDRFVEDIHAILLDRDKSYARRYHQVFTHWMGLIAGRDRVRGTEHDIAVFRILSEKMLSGAVPPVQLFIEEGRERNLFHTDHSRQAATVIVYGIYGILYEEWKRVGSNRNASAIFAEAKHLICLLLNADESVFCLETE